MEEIKFTREELYDLVWSEPMSRLAKKYNLSNNGLKKRCKKMMIPYPPVGYWSKIKYGYKVPKPKLSKNFKGETETVLCFRDKHGKYVETEKPINPIKLLRDEIIKDTSLPLSVPKQIEKFDSLVNKAKRVLDKKKSIYFSGNYVGMRSTDRETINIMVSETNIERSLYFMDSLIKLLKARKHQLIVENNSTYAVVYGEKLNIRLKEKSKVVYDTNEFGREERQLHPNGKLAFIFYIHSYYQKEWVDGNTLIESRLPEILAYFEITAKNEKQSRIEREQRRKQEEEERQRRKELQRKKDDEFKKIRILIDNANFWKQAQILREYIQAFECKKDLNPELQEWLLWAKDKVEWLDPFICKNDLLLDDSDRQKLFNELKESMRINQRSYW